MLSLDELQEFFLGHMEEKTVIWWFVSREVQNTTYYIKSVDENTKAVSWTQHIEKAKKFVSESVAADYLKRHGINGRNEKIIKHGI